MKCSPLCSLIWEGVGWPHSSCPSASIEASRLQPAQKTFISWHKISAAAGKWVNTFFQPYGEGEELFRLAQEVLWFRAIR